MKSLPLLFTSFLLLITLSAFGQKPDGKSASPEPASAQSERLIYQIVEKMPIFPGCEDLEDYGEAKTCAQIKMLKFVYGQLKYPEEALKYNIAGTVVIRFVIEADGQITNATIAREVGQGCGEEGLRIVNKMPNWNPGIQGGKPVAVYFNLPIKFKIDDERPTFPGCEAEEDKNKRERCARKKMDKFIQANLKYPEEAKAKLIEGKVKVTFTVTKEGEIINAKVADDQNKNGFGEEALRIINNMPRWNPGKQFEIAVDMSHQFSVSFYLEKQVPYLPGCDGDKSEYSRNRCTREKANEFVANNLKYPKEAKREGIEGSVLVKFMVQKDGKVADLKIVKDIGGGCAEEAIRLIKNMPLWIPGKKGDLVADFPFQLYISFNLEDKE